MGQLGCSNCRPGRVCAPIFWAGAHTQVVVPRSRHPVSELGLMFFPSCVFWATVIFPGHALLRR